MLSIPAINQIVVKGRRLFAMGYATFHVSLPHNVGIFNESKNGEGTELYGLASS